MSQSCAQRLRGPKPRFRGSSRGAATRKWTWLRLLAFVSLVPLTQAQPFTQTTRTEFHVTGDFDGDGRVDIAILQHRSNRRTHYQGNYRVGYQRPAGQFTWSRARNCGIYQPSGVTAGRFLAPDRDALAVTSPDFNAILLLDLVNPATDPGTGQAAARTLGPLCLATLRPKQSKGLDRLAVVSCFNDPVADQIEILQFQPDGADTLGVWDLPKPAPLSNGVTWRLVKTLQVGHQESPFVTAIVEPHLLWPREPTAPASFLVLDLSVGGPQSRLEIPGLPGETDCLIGAPEEHGGSSVYVFSSRTNELTRYRLGLGSTNLTVLTTNLFRLPAPVRTAAICDGVAGCPLVAALGRGERVARLIFNDGDTVAELQVVESPPELWFSGLVPVGDHLVALLSRPTSQYAWPYSVAYQVWRMRNGHLEAGLTSNLPTPDEAVWRIHPVFRATWILRVLFPTCQPMLGRA